MTWRHLRILVTAAAIVLSASTASVATAEPSRLTMAPLVSCLRNPADFNTLQSLYETCFKEAVIRIEQRKDVIRDGETLRTTTLVNGQSLAQVVFCADRPCAVIVRNPNGREYLKIDVPRPPTPRYAFWMLSGSLEWFDNGDYFEQSWDLAMATQQPWPEDYRMFKSFGVWLRA